VNAAHESRQTNQGSEGMTTKAQMAKTKRTPKYSTRIVRRCELTGRAHGVYRKFRISRIMLRKLALEGKIPGMRKASW
jgi:small subunit ribosomal protein S14